MPPPLDVPLKFLDQDYQELKKSCLTNKMIYVDKKFPSDSSSIGPGKKLGLDMEKIKWLRPSEIVKDPKLIVEGVSRFDFSQGYYLGNCAFLAPLGSLTFQKDLMDQVMPVGQSFGEDYAGIFHFRFWKSGEWTDVVIDDKLPTINDKLIFLRKTSNEFWPALLEKAYAKFCGSYASTSGDLSEALLDFTGGIHVHYETATASIDLWSLMNRAAKAKALIACCSFFKRSGPANGIFLAHAYTVTGFDEVTYRDKPVRLVRVLNPQGKNEWTGDWSDESLLWDRVSEKERSRCRSLANDGEFWISMEDFTKNFKGIDICCLSPDFLDSKCKWTSTCYKDSWVDGTTAGGSLDKDSFWKNPQFRVRIEKLDKEYSGQCPENILVSLMQYHEKRNRRDAPSFAIGFYVFAIPPEMKDVKLPDKFLYQKQPIERSDKFISIRHVMKFFKLEPGEYLIVPATLNPKESAKFILSIFSKVK